MRRRTVVARALCLAAISSVAFAGCGLPGGGAGSQRVRAGTGGGAGVAVPEGTHAAPAEAAKGAGAGTEAAAAPAPPLLLAAARDTQPPSTLAAAAPSTSPGSIEVRYRRGGGTSTASLIGPDGGRSTDVTDGVARFDNLTPGSYELRISHTSDAAAPAPPTQPGVAIGGAFDATRYGSFEVVGGQSLVLTCDETSCTSS